MIRISRVDMTKFSTDYTSIDAYSYSTRSTLAPESEKDEDSDKLSSIKDRSVYLQ